MKELAVILARDSLALTKLKPCYLETTNNAIRNRTKPNHEIAFALLLADQRHSIGKR